MAAAPGTVRAETIRFTEAAGSAAGSYSGSFEVPVGAMLIDVIVHAVALWTAGTNALLIVGDTADDNGFYDAVSLKATDLTLGQSLSFAIPGGKYGADIAPNDATGATLILGQAGHVSRRSLTAARNLTAKVVTTGTVGTAGITDVTFVYAYTSPMAPTFVAT